MTILICVDTNSSSAVAIPLNPSLATAKGRLRTPSDQQTTSEAGSAEWAVLSCLPGNPSCPVGAAEREVKSLQTDRD